MSKLGACADPQCPVLHNDPENPIHPVPFGTHAGLDEVPPLTFSEQVGVDGLPLWELHEGCKCDFTQR